MDMPWGLCRLCILSLDVPPMIQLHLSLADVKLGFVPDDIVDEGRGLRDHLDQGGEDRGGCGEDTDRSEGHVLSSERFAADSVTGGLSGGLECSEQAPGAGSGFDVGGEGREDPVAVDLDPIAGRLDEQVGEVGSEPFTRLGLVVESDLVGVGVVPEDAEPDETSQLGYGPQGESVPRALLLR